MQLDPAGRIIIICPLLWFTANWMVNSHSVTFAKIAICQLWSSMTGFWFSHVHHKNCLLLVVYAYLSICACLAVKFSLIIYVTLNWFYSSYYQGPLASPCDYCPTVPLQLTAVCRLSYSCISGEERKSSMYVKFVAFPFWDPCEPFQYDIYSCYHPCCSLFDLS
jgi:hypothetical protein